MSGTRDPQVKLILTENSDRPEGDRATKLPKILLNGNNICMVGPKCSALMDMPALTCTQMIPGGSGEEVFVNKDGEPMMQED